MFIAEMKTSIIDYMRESQRWCAAAAAPVSSFPPLLLHLSLANVGTCAATATHNPLLHPPFHPSQQKTQRPQSIWPTHVLSEQMLCATRFSDISRGSMCFWNCRSLLEIKQNAYYETTHNSSLPPWNIALCIKCPWFHYPNNPKIYLKPQCWCWVAKYHLSAWYQIDVTEK